MREDFVKFKFCEASLKLFNLIFIKSEEEAGHRMNYQCLGWQLHFVLNVLSSSGSTKIASTLCREITRENDFQAFFRITSNSGLIAVARALTMRAFIALFQTLLCLIFLMNSGPRKIARVAIRKR